MWGVHLSVSYFFAFPYSSWSSQGKNTEVVFHCLLHWTTFCQNISTMTCPSKLNQDGRVEGHALIFTHLLLRELQNYNSLLNNRLQENIGSHQKKIPYVQGQRRSPSKMVGGVKLHLESNPIPTRDAQRAQTKPCAHQETPQRLSQTCL